jgi:hypothetical protein
MCFLRSATGYTRLDKVRSEVIRKEPESSGIQDVRSKHKQNWINHLERMDNIRLPKHALNYKPRERRDRGRPRKRWQRVDAGTGQTTQSMDENVDDHLQIHSLSFSYLIDLDVHLHPIQSYYRRSYITGLRALLNTCHIITDLKMYSVY